MLWGCSDGVVRVEITDLVERAKYVELLNEKGLKYSVDDRGVLSVKAASFEELTEKMKDYEEWRNAKLRSDGVLILDQ